MINFWGQESTGCREYLTEGKSCPSKGMVKLSFGRKAEVVVLKKIIVVFLKESCLSKEND